MMKVDDYLKIEEDEESLSSGTVKNMGHTQRACLFSDALDFRAGFYVSIANKHDDLYINMTWDSRMVC